MAAVLPLFVLGGAAIYAHRASQPVENMPTEDERIADTQRAILHEYGASAAAYQQMLDKLIIMGGIVNDGVGQEVGSGVDPRDPSSDSLEEVFEKHVQLMNFDRADTLLSLRTHNGEIVPRKRNPIAVTLSEELTHPNDPSRKSEIYASKVSPAYANPAQMEMARRWMQANPETEQEISLRAWDGSQFMATAAGLNFRYSED